VCEPGVSGADRTPDQRPGAAPSLGVRHYPRRRICRKSNLFTRPPPVPRKSPGEGTSAFVAAEDGTASGTLCRKHVAVRHTAPGGQPADPVGTPSPMRPESVTQPPLSAVTSGVGEYRIPSYGKSVWRRLSDGGPDIGPALTPADDRYQISSAPACHNPAPPAATPPPTPCPDAPPAGPFPAANR
jgi:hypothetical protein